MIFGLETYSLSDCSVLREWRFRVEINMTLALMGRNPGAWLIVTQETVMRP